MYWKFSGVCLIVCLFNICEQVKRKRFKATINYVDNIENTLCIWILDRQTFMLTIQYNGNFSITYIYIFMVFILKFFIVNFFNVHFFCCCCILMFLLHFCLYITFILFSYQRPISSNVQKRERCCVFFPFSNACYVFLYTLFSNAAMLKECACFCG